MTYLSK